MAKLKMFCIIEPVYGDNIVKYKLPSTPTQANKSIQVFATHAYYLKCLRNI